MFNNFYIETSRKTFSFSQRKNIFCEQSAIFPMDEKEFSKELSHFPSNKLSSLVSFHNLTKVNFIHELALVRKYFSIESHVESFGQIFHDVADLEKSSWKKIIQLEKWETQKKSEDPTILVFLWLQESSVWKSKKRNWTNPNILKLSVNCRNIKKSREQRKETELVVSFLAPFFKLSPQWCSLSHLWLDQSQKVSKSLNIIHKIKFIDSSCRTRQTGLLVFFS